MDFPAEQVAFHQFMLLEEEEAKQPAGTPAYTTAAEKREGYAAARTFYQKK